MSFLDVEDRRVIIDRRAIAERLHGLRLGKKVSEIGRASCRERV